MRSVLTACMLVSAVAAAAGQEARPVATPEQGKPVLISGCLDGGPSSYTLATQPATRLPHERADVPVGTSGRSITYVLTPHDELDLSKHLGKKVEIRGALLPARPGPAPAVSATKGEPDVKRDDSPDVKPEADTGADIDAATLVRPNVAVTSVRVVSGSCR